MPNLRIGYAFDQSFLTGYNQNSTHEIMLENRIPSKAVYPCGRYMDSDYWYY